MSIKICKILRFLFEITAIMVIANWSLVHAAIVNVSNVTQLEDAIANANSSGGNTTILLKDGIYTLNKLLRVDGSNISVGSQSGIRENVVIQGDEMSSNASITHIFLVYGDDFNIRDITLQKCGYHIIQIKGEHNVDNFSIRNCILRDSYEQILKVSGDQNNPSISSDNGIVENCLFEYSAGIGPQWYIGGIDAHSARNWIVRRNTFKNIISPSNAVAEFAIHFWDYTENNLVENNLILNCDRGIGFGLGSRGNLGGVIRNNMIYHAGTKGRFADVGIALATSPGSEVYNNTVFLESDFPWAIEYRFSETTNVLIANNLSNLPVMLRNGASATLSNNVTNADETWFKDISSGDLHMSYAADSVVDRGQEISGLNTDYDGEIRPQGDGIDIGADEFTGDFVPQPPKNLRIISMLSVLFFEN